MWPFVEGSMARQTFEAMVRDAYRSFRHSAVAPSKQLTHDVWLLELFHGPTLAFKDFALQLLGVCWIISWQSVASAVWSWVRPRVIRGPRRSKEHGIRSIWMW